MCQLCTKMLPVWTEGTTTAFNNTSVHVDILLHSTVFRQTWKIVNFSFKHKKQCAEIVISLVIITSNALQHLGVEVWDGLPPPGLPKQTVPLQLGAATGLSATVRRAAERRQPGILGCWVPALCLEQPIAWAQPRPGQHWSMAPTVRSGQNVPTGSHV